ncbi:Protein CBG22425 [Caenorhabditis briggsae]|uniref:Protein CBG22425 n=1 Tax=Caenorhabditis briggsae TaxID=6238 RepID=A8Y293_CAEBR|nr:Protein CBG22425 [Caenorhabditis briggsae]CAP39013.1 Protein CBG22425 [Caenorhabditis briggsae]
MCNNAMVTSYTRSVVGTLSLVLHRIIQKNSGPGLQDPGSRTRAPEPGHQEMSSSTLAPAPWLQHPGSSTLAPAPGLRNPSSRTRAPETALRDTGSWTRAPGPVLQPSDLSSFSGASRRRELILASTFLFLYSAHPGVNGPSEGCGFFTSLFWWI